MTLQKAYRDNWNVFCINSNYYSGMFFAKISKKYAKFLDCFGIGMVCDGMFFAL